METPVFFSKYGSFSVDSDGFLECAAIKGQEEWLVNISPDKRDRCGYDLYPGAVPLGSKWELDERFFWQARAHAHKNLVIQ